MSDVTRNSPPGRPVRPTGGRTNWARSSRRVRMCLPLLLAAFLEAGCGGAGRGQLVFSTAGGFILGFVYLDTDGSGTPGGPDLPLPGVAVRLLVSGTIDTVARANSDANGSFVFGAQPVGRYRIVVTSSSVLGDSLRVARVDTADVTLGVDDTSSVRIAIAFPSYTTSEARLRPIGEKFFVAGVALSSRSTFGDLTVHLRDTTGAIRVTEAQGPDVTAGDSLRFLGVAGARDGQPVLDAGFAWKIQVGGAPVAVDVTSAVAAVADAAGLDADLVRVLDATVGDTSTVNGDYVATVDDGSGPVQVVFDQQAGLTRSPFVPGVTMDATGVLVPDGTGRWVLKPRSNLDVVLK